MRGGSIRRVGSHRNRGRIYPGLLSMSRSEYGRCHQSTKHRANNILQRIRLRFRVSRWQNGHLYKIILE
jgi:hypothetical protein